MQRIGEKWCSVSSDYVLFKSESNNMFYSHSCIRKRYYPCIYNFVKVHVLNYWILLHVINHLRITITINAGPLGPFTIIHVPFLCSPYSVFGLWSTSELFVNMLMPAKIWSLCPAYISVALLITDIRCSYHGNQYQCHWIFTALYGAAPITS